jgi:hypothetical protein
MTQRLTTLCKTEFKDHATKSRFQFTVAHAERVKSYAPRVFHYVFDVRVFVLPLVPASVDFHSLFWKDIFPKHQPTVLKGCYLGEAGSGKWTAEYLKSATAERKDVVSVHVTDPGVKAMNYVGKKNYGFQSMSFPDLVEKAQEASQPENSELPRIYLRSMGLKPNKQTADFYASYPELASDFIVPSFIPITKQFSSVLRVGSSDLKLWTHYDVTDNLLCHLVGHKKVILFPPDQAANLYLPTDLNSSSSPITELDVKAHPEILDKYPKFATALEHAIEITLSPGDILFIPALWFHNVTTVDFAASVNIFWKNLEKPLYQEKDLYGNKDLVAGSAAMQATQAVAAEFAKLPKTVELEQYKQFYQVRCNQIISQAWAVQQEK